MSRAAIDAAIRLAWMHGPRCDCRGCLDLVAAVEAFIGTPVPETTEGEAPLRAELNQIARNWETMETTFAAYRFCAEEIREALNRTAP